MSDYYLIHMNFALGVEAPEPLIRALGLRAKGERVTEADTEGLPGLIRSYLSSGGTPGDGVYGFETRVPHKLGTGGKGAEPDPKKAHLTTHHLRMAQTFHDDEYYNGGMFYPFWLMQFAAFDGPLATKQQTNGMDIPGVISKFGDRIIETHLKYAPDWLCREPPDPDNPVVVSRTHEWPLSDMLTHMADFADDYA